MAFCLAEARKVHRDATDIPVRMVIAEDGSLREWLMPDLVRALKVRDLLEDRWKHRRIEIAVHPYGPQIFDGFDGYVWDGTGIEPLALEDDDEDEDF